MESTKLRNTKTITNGWYIIKVGYNDSIQNKEYIS